MARRRGQRKGHLFEEGGYWKLRYRVDTPEMGRRDRITVTIARATGPGAVGKREAARIAWEEYLSRLDVMAMRPSSMRSLGEFVTERFSPDVLPALKPSGRIFYEAMLRKHVLPGLGSTRLRELTTARVQELLNAKIQAGLSVQTVVHIRNTISAILRHARAMQWFAGELPTAAVRLPEMRRKERRALRWDQVCELARLLPAPVSKLVVFLTLTGLRIGEAAALRWKRVNLSESEFLVVEGEVVPPLSLAVRENFVRGRYQSLKTSRSSRNVPIPAWFVPYLLELRASSAWRGPEDPVFAAACGRPIDEHNLAARVLKPTAQTLGLDWVSWHVFRHTNATLADQIGMSVAERQRILGHAAPAMTLHYTKADLDLLRERWERLVDPTKLLQ